MHLLTLQERSVAGCWQDAGPAGAGGPPEQARTGLSGGCWSDRAAAEHSDSPLQRQQTAKIPDCSQMHSSIWDWHNTQKSPFPLRLFVTIIPSHCGTLLPNFWHKSIPPGFFSNWFYPPNQSSFYSTQASQAESKEFRFAYVPRLLQWPDSNLVSSFTVCCPQKRCCWISCSQIYQWWRHPSGKFWSDFNRIIFI